MSTNPPFDLGSLADVESPEVVKGALRTFRRRTLRTFVWVVLVATMIGVPLVRQGLSKDFAESVEAAPGYDVGTLYASRGVTVLLARVADLEDMSAVRLIVTAPDLPGEKRLFLTLENGGPEATQRGPRRVVDGWFSVRVPDDGVLRLSVFVDIRCEVHPSKENPNLRVCDGVQQVDPHESPEREFTIDLKAAGVPERFWRKG